MVSAGFSIITLALTLTPTITLMLLLTLSLLLLLPHQALAFLCHLAEARGVWGPFLVVAPASTLHNWDKELSQFTPGFKVRTWQ
jgi:hypothetical protein